jgi:UDP-glucose 4-epimerase
MTKILVTGGAGFIGSNLVRRLVHEGHAVRVLDDYSRSRPERLQDIEQAIELVQGDVRDFDQVDRATKGCEVVFHLAAVNGTENFYKHPDQVLEVGIKGTMHTMDAAIKHGCRRYIFASSAEVYQEPTRCPTDERERLVVPDVTNPRLSYGGSKLIGELLSVHYLARHGIEAIAFRPHNIYGSDMGHEHVIPQFFARLCELRRGGAPGPHPFPIQGDGTQTRAFCFIQDCIEGIMLLLAHGKSGEIYHVGNPTETSINNLAMLMAKIVGVQIVLEPGSVPEGSTPRRCPAISKVSALGFTPTVSLEQGLRITYEQEWKPS